MWENKKGKKNKGGKRGKETKMRGNEERINERKIKGDVINEGRGEAEK